MPIKLIGKSILGELGLSQNPVVMENNFDYQLNQVKECLPRYKEIIMTSMTGFSEREATNNEYYPKIREYRTDIANIFDPKSIYTHCLDGKDKYRPCCDFLIFNSNLNQLAITFSREAPILAFESSIGRKALGVILRPSLMKYGDALFSTIKDDLTNHDDSAEITVTLVTCNHFNYPEGSIPSIIQNLAIKYKMKCFVCVDSEKDNDCYHRGEKGNHVVALW